MKTNFLLLIVLFTFIGLSPIKSQLYKVSFKERVNQASIIVEGEITDSYSYKGQDGHIYTANSLRIISKLKGNLQESVITVVTFGGQLEEERETWTHLLTLKKGCVGLFFLVPTNREKPEDTDNFCYEVYSSSQGFIEYKLSESKDRVECSAPFNDFKNISELYAQLLNEGNIQVHNDLGWDEYLKDREDKPACIDYQLDLIDIKFEGADIIASVDVLIRSSLQSVMFSQGAIIATYNTNELGEYIVQNGAISFEEIGISSQSNYVIEAEDVDYNKLKLRIRALSTNISLLATLTENYTSLFRFRISLTSLETPSIILDNVEMLGNSHFVDPNSSDVTKFDCINVSSVFSLSCPAPVITSFDPSPPLSLSAGVDDTLTIRGMCFDTIRGASVVEFTDARSGPTPTVWVSPLAGDYIEWSDTLIRVLVPSVIDGGNIAQSAGTDRFRVRVASTGGIAVSPLDINIDYAALNFGTGMFSTPANTSIPILLSNFNGFGGQSIYYSSNFLADTNAVKAFERALVNWTCNTFVNYRIQDSILIPNINRAGRIEFANLPVGVSTTLASTDNVPYTPCSDSGTIVGANRRKFEIKFNQNLMWHTSVAMPISLPANTFDLESRALHELGHAHLLNHSNNPGDLMYFTDLTPPYRRTIMPNDLAGGLYIVSISTSPSPVGCQANMVSLTPADCGSVTTIIEIDGNELEVNLFPNPTRNIIKLELGNWSKVNAKDLHLHLYDLQGRRLKSSPIISEESEIDVTTLPSGSYVIILINSGVVIYSSSIIKD